MNKEIGRELEILIKARYPILYIVSWEEQRVESEIENIAKESSRPKKIFTWSITEGITDKKDLQDDSCRDPLVALDYILKCTDPAIFIFKDFHSFMQEPTIMRKIRDIALAFKQSYKTLIFLSPSFKIPQDLEKDITVIDFPLPDLKDLEILLDHIMKQVQANPKARVDLNSSGKEKLLKAALGLTLTEAENVFAKAIVVDGKLNEDDISVVISEKEQIIRKTGILEYYHASEVFTDIGGLEHLKEWLLKRGKAFTDKARTFGLPQPKGILLLGTQGCGKSLTAKAIAALWKLPLLRLDVGKIFAGFVGSSEENVRKAIKVSESVSPCVLWIDEIEKGFSGTQSSNFSDGGTTARVFGAFLTWLQEKVSPVFVVATANNIEQLPPELLRKGRLDEIFFIDLPNSLERKEIFKIHIKKRKREPDQFALTELVKESEGFSGAEIEQAIISALYDGFDEDRPVTSDDIVKNLKQTVPLSKTMKEQIDSARKWAETRARKASKIGLSEEVVKASRIEI